MAGLKSALVFVLQAIIVGLAVAFVVVIVRPDLMPGIGGSPQEPASYAEAVAAAAPSVVNVYTKRLVQETALESEGPRFRVDTTFASAVVIDADGYLVTNYHVFEDELTEIRVQFSDGRIAEAGIVGLDAETDLALLKVELSGLQPIRLGRSDDLQIGDVVLAIGNP